MLERFYGISSSLKGVLSRFYGVSISIRVMEFPFLSKLWSFHFYPSYGVSVALHIRGVSTLSQIFMEFSSLLWESWFAMEFTFLEEECITKEFLTLQ